MRKHTSPPATAQPCVLLIGPDDHQRFELRSILLDAGCRTFICARSCDAIDLIKFASVVIFQHSLPDGSWRDVLRAAQSLEKTPGVIFPSRLAGVELCAEVVNLGGYDVLAQPFRAEEVMWTVRSAHRRWSAPGETGAAPRSTRPGRRVLVAQASR